MNIHGVILAAGKGERMHPLTEAVPKALLFVGGKPLIAWAVEGLRKAGIDKIVVATGWKGRMVEGYIESSDMRVDTVNVVDYEIGPLQTLFTALNSFDDDFLLVPVDTMIDSFVISGLIAHHSQTQDMTLAVDLDTDLGTPVSISGEGIITGLGDHILASDTIVHSAMLFAGNSNLSQHCGLALADGETKFVSVLNRMIQDGETLRYHSSDVHIIDIDTLDDLLSVNRLVLKHTEFNQASSQVFVPIGDRIEIGKTLALNSDITLGKGTELNGPVLISQRTKIGEQCQIGPYTTFDSDSVVSDECEISDTIIFGQSRISARSRLHQTIVYNSKQYGGIDE
ncbi:MAG: NTP transferase domain-containing protein [Promethearchaeota archaeon]